MVDLATLVLGADGRAMAPLGTWLHAPESPFRRTLDVRGAPAEILGAAPFDGDAALEAVLVTVAGRERAPLLAAAGTRLWRVEGGWGAVETLDPGEAIRVPERGPAGLTVAWARVRAVRRHAPPPALFEGTAVRWGTLTLARGAWSFPVPSGFIHV